MCLLFVNLFSQAFICTPKGMSKQDKNLSFAFICVVVLFLFLPLLFKFSYLCLIVANK